MPTAIITTTTMPTTKQHTYTYSRKRPLQDTSIITTTVANSANGDKPNKRAKLSNSSSESDSDGLDGEDRAAMRKKRGTTTVLAAKKGRSSEKATITSLFRTKNNKTSTTKSTSSASPKPTTTKSSSASTSKPKLRQLHLAIGSTSLKTCPHCDLSYTLGAPDDESLHRTHCSRVQRGIEWTRDVDKDPEVVDVARGITLKDDKTRGRIVSVRGDIGGKVGSKMTTLLSTIDLALSSPPLTREILKKSKIYLFLLPCTSTTGTKEKIAGCVVAQRIQIARALTTNTTGSEGSDSGTPGGALSIRPTPLPTPLGIARLFVSSKCRRLGIASELLTYVASTFIHGCPLDPSKGEVAFTQPTSAGEGVMMAWGKGGVRVYEECES